MKPGSVRLSQSAVRTPATDCAAAWNGYASKRDHSSFCTGYDAWYVYSRAGNPVFKTFGPVADWHRQAKARGMAGRSIQARAIAWWPAAAGRAARVAYVERIANFALVVSEMNAERWNQVTTRTIPLESPEMPKVFISLVSPTTGTPPTATPVSPPREPASPWRPQLPRLGGAPARGEFRTG